MQFEHGRGAIWFFAVFALVASAAAWWYLAPDSLPAFVRQQLPVSPTSNPVLYKWRDAKGGLHVTDTPPTDRPFETVHYDPKVNVVPTVVPSTTKQP
jgi:hypothetical protein